MKIEIPEKLGAVLKVQANPQGASRDGYVRESSSVILFRRSKRTPASSVQDRARHYINLKTAARSSVSQSACASENLAPEETAERGAQNELPS